MPITTIPNNNPSSAYRPVVYRALVFTLFLLERATVDIIVDGVTITTVSQPPFFNLGPFQFFDIDVQSILQRDLGPKSSQKATVFPTVNTAQNTNNNDLQSTVELSVTYQYRDATTNQLVDLGVTDTTAAPLPVLAGTRQHEQSMNFLDYIIAGFGGNGLFMTDRPQNEPVCLTDLRSLSYLNSFQNAARIQTFDSNGVLIDSGRFLLPAITVSPQMQTIGVGPEQIRNTTFFVGAVNIDNPLVATYTVDTGLELFGVYAPLSTTYTFELVSCCADHIRIHFMNYLGGADAFTFTSVYNRTYGVSSARGQKPLDWTLTAPNNDTQQRGGFRYNIEAGITYEARSSKLYIDEALWLEQLLSTPEAYFEDERLGQLRPIEILDGEFVTINTEGEDEIGVELVVRFRISNDRIIQRT